MKHLHPRFLLLAAILLSTSLLYTSRAQNVAINSTGNAPAASSILDISETGKGILIPRMTLANRPSSPATSLLIYQLDNTPGFYYWDGSIWVMLLSGTSAGGIYAGSGSLSTDPTTVTMGTNKLAFTSNVANAFSVDGTTFSINTSSNMVGIGTITPAQPLTVLGDILMGGTSTNYDGNAEGIKIIGRSDDWYIGVQNETTVGASDFFIGLNDDTEDGIFHIQNDGHVSIGTSTPSSWAKLQLEINDADDAFYIKNTNITANTSAIFRIDATSAASNAFRVERNGRVGIGSSAPAYNLEIQSNNDAAIYLEADVDNATESDNAFIKFSQDNTAIQAILGTVGSAGFDPENVAYTGTIENSTLFGTTKNYDLQFGTNDNVRMTIERGGDVGIGTTVPNVKLHVEGGDIRINATSGQGYPDLIFSGQGTQVNLRNDGARLWVHSNAATSMRLNIATNYSNDLGLSLLYTPGTVGAGTGVFQIGQTQKNNANYTHGITSFFTDGSERMRITVDGDVGIGNTAPTEELDVTGDIRASGTAYWGSSGTRTETKNDAGTLGGRSGYYETSSATTAENWPLNGSWWHLLDVRHSNVTNNYSMQLATSFFDPDPDLYFRKTANNAAHAWTKVITADNISSYGDNLGNHTATTTLDMANLNVDNVNRLEFNDPGDQEGIIWTGSAAKIFVSPLNGGNSDGYLRLINDGGIVFESGAEDTEVMTLTAAGDVGIGTTAPTRKLHVTQSLSTYIPVTQLSNTGSNGVALETENTSTSNDKAAIESFINYSGSTVVPAVYGSSNASSGSGRGLEGYAGSSTGTGIFGSNVSTGWAIYASGWAGGTTAWQNVSDRRLKKEITPISNVMNNIMKLRPVEFYWDRENHPRMNLPEGVKLGFIAQEVELIYPSLVVEKNIQSRYDPNSSESTDNDESTRYKVMDYTSLIPVLTEAIQEHQRVIQEQQKTIDTLKARLEKLEGGKN